VRQSWTLDELIDHWTLLPAEQDVLGESKEANRLDLAVMLKVYGLEGRQSLEVYSRLSLGDAQ